MRVSILYAYIYIIYKCLAILCAASIGTKSMTAANDCDEELVAVR